MDQVTIELARIGKPARTYHEGLLSDNGIELRTQTILSAETRTRFSAVWHIAGYITPDLFIKSVRKILFYHEYFTIMQLLDDEWQSLGCYVDIASPLQKKDGIYHLTDLILDLWIYPNGTYQELDVDEYEIAVTSGKLKPEWEMQSRRTFDLLKTSISTSNFPYRYLSV